MAPLSSLGRRVNSLFSTRASPDADLGHLEEATAQLRLEVLELVLDQLLGLLVEPPDLLRLWRVPALEFVP